MKNFFIFCVIFFMTVSSACAQSAMPTEEDYKNLDQLRSKLVRMKREMDKFVKDVIASSGEEGVKMISSLDQDIRVDVTQDDKSVIVRADLPGMDKDKINIVLENSRILKISGEREMSKSQAAPGMVRQERMYGKFERVLELPAECMSSGINANYKNGVLEVTIPKKKMAKEEVVKIKVQ